MKLKAATVEELQATDKRQEIPDDLCTGLYQCDPQDAAHICATYLAELETGGPVMGDLLGTVTRDALFWADCAPAHELVAYGTAALERLRGLALGMDTRKRLFARLWETFDPRDRQAFLTRVDAVGRFLRKGAA